MARGSTTAREGSSDTLPCGENRQAVVDRGHHRPGCGARYAEGCNSLDCQGECLVTNEHCDGEAGDDE
ncbi:hypothetical protein I0C86_40465 [Plantactinospora sp. S1510]|uniref:Uncharacterized protein n=1 Tax=Plantactinospora alkalitolerans TaxID=2789879 RepID=A0ABS0H9K1_9ACTN|nr:hypothetical protein [Plantactinospora alkalitolerans]MBF9135155.1 hypothetical protein [Plantactinospora alkalitolerans]